MDRDFTGEINRSMDVDLETDSFSFRKKNWGPVLVGSLDRIRVFIAQLRVLM